MLGLYIPLLMSLLLREEEEGAASSLVRTQHELVLAKLTAIAAQFPLEFKVRTSKVCLFLVAMLSLFRIALYGSGNMDTVWNYGKSG